MVVMVFTELIGQASSGVLFLFYFVIAHLTDTAIF